MQTGFLHKAETAAILGACFEVYNEKGCGFTELIYQECLEMELSLRRIAFDAQRRFPLYYKGHKLEKVFIPDLTVFDKVIVELKAVPELANEHRCQLLNYLHATDFKVGLLVNFGHYPKLEYERMIN